MILLIRIFDGTLRPGDTVISLGTRKKYIVGEVGIMHPHETATGKLRAGQVGYVFFNPGMKNSKEAKVGDTFTHVGKENEIEPCATLEEPQPMVFVGAFPIDQSEFNHLDDRYCTHAPKISTPIIYPSADSGWIGYVAV